MSHVLFINVFGHGHINPTISIVSELVDRGEKVTYIAGEEFKDKIEGAGARFIGYKNFDELGFNNGDISPTEIEPQLMEIARVYVEIIEIVFSIKDNFDYVIYDSLFFVGAEIAKILKIPAISSNSTFAVNDKTNYLWSFFTRFGPVIKELLNKPDFAAINFLREKYGIIVPDLLGLHKLKSDLSLVYTSRYFQMNSESFDDSYKFIGPSISDRQEILAPELISKEKSKIIYISLGTIFNKSIEFYESCFEAFRGMDAKIIMSVGMNIDIDSFKDIPDNFIIRNYVPQLEILKHADLFITHGGMNSTNEGLYYSVPLIVVPHFFDQPVVAYRVAELGAGIVIEKDKVSPALLKDSVTKILSDKSYKVNSEKIGKSLRESGGNKKGVDEILILKDRKKAAGELIYI
ncbi:macrolide family glycosyltransferase [Clostridium sp. BNL1100]|uniref:macrolide family glycosyltransferase n=1 Tax=Clostridium sp. BNL1100 TaxID=755731 RepID=UPI00024A7AFF|nr:macrolide family glycosyltransferase [Clostridium sp. BNL1100]AEY67948.1 glycosyltransferase, MGT family [Clostridium sp. BNL1100]